MPEGLSAFNPETFLDQEIDTQFDTKYALVPDDDYTALIDNVVGREFINKETGERGIIADVTYELMDCDEVKETLGLKKAVVKQGLFLEYENGVLADGTGKNVKLGKLREATGQDKKGKPWKFSMLIGAGPVVVHVVQDGDYNKVVRVSAPL